MAKHPENSIAIKPILVPVDTACAVIGCGRTKIYDLLAQKKIRSICIGRRRLIVVASLEALAQ